ncbi:MAG TPA: P-type conjugative transfer protein TrbL, partial [Kiloniellaceae bacterium]|nr:P-type conjugative transfer protein TrbL [Kiloniellaceae bacterium]
MDDLNVIDRFTTTFSDYIDRGFGLLSPDVAFLTSILIAIDVVLVSLFWALNREGNVIGQLIKKVLYVGFFALILNNFEVLTGIIFDSFAGLGLTATDTSITADQLLRPGFVAAAGFEAAHPLIEDAKSKLGFTSFFDNAATILILLFTWLVVVLSFFILSVQIFITIIEFKLTTLAGFVLVPFALWNKSAFLAERVLGNVISAGIKLMVLAVIVGIGSTMFADIASGLRTADITIESSAAMLLASIALLGLGVFGPGIAAGLVSGAPQLGAGAAVGTAAGLAAGTVAGAGLAVGAARVAGGGISSATRAAASMAGGTGTAFNMASAASGTSGVAA